MSREHIHITLQELLHAINILGEDRDVFVDGIDSIAVCTPVKLTPEGRKHFDKALNARVEIVYEDDEYEDVYVSDNDEDIDEEAWNLLASLAGYCPESKFKIWFEGETAEMI